MGWNLWHTAASARAKLIEDIRVPIPQALAPQGAAARSVSG
jgi:hypothetical protein